MRPSQRRAAAGSRGSSAAFQPLEEAVQGDSRTEAGTYGPVRQGGMAGGRCRRGNRQDGRNHGRRQNACQDSSHSRPLPAHHSRDGLDLLRHTGHPNGLHYRRTPAACKRKVQLISPCRGFPYKTPRHTLCGAPPVGKTAMSLPGTVPPRCQAGTHAVAGWSRKVGFPMPGGPCATQSAVSACLVPVAPGGLAH